jgi:hypothetical protein
MFKSARSLAVGVVIGLGAGVTTSVAWAAIPGTGGVISGCISPADATGQHTLALLDTAQSAVCQANQTLITWNQAGPAGPKGDPGTSATIKTDPIAPGNATCPAGGQFLVVENNGVPVSGRWPAVCNGAAGALGATGPQGLQGPAGSQGPAGAQGPAGPGNGYQTFSFAASVGPISNTRETMYCPGNAVPITGSVIPTGLAQSPDPALTWIVYSGQVDAHSWMTEWNNSSPNIYNMTFQVVCINPS